MKAFNVTVRMRDRKYWHTVEFPNVKAGSEHTAITACVRTARRKPGLKGLRIREVIVTCVFVCTVKKVKPLPAPLPETQEVAPCSS